MTLPTIIKLAQFSSFIEVFIGINLVFSIWETLRENASNKFKTKSEKHRVSLGAKLGKNFETGRCAAKFNQKIKEHSDRLQTLCSFSKWCGLVISCVLCLTLVVIGLNPEFEVEINAALIFIAITGLPSIFLLMVGNIYVLHAENDIEKFCNQQNDAIEDLKSTYPKS
ncbi:hypothetical protein [Aeromonas veronii]|uniref:hypothetical protein n=1 Tax=Aeromonas veronii TaxID=654 RepID=UPI003006B509